MGFCPICYGNHDPDIRCNATDQILRDIGIERKSENPMSAEELKKVENKEKIFFIFLALFFAGLALFVIVLILANR